MGNKTILFQSSILLTLLLALGQITQADSVIAMAPTSIDIFTTTDQPINVIEVFPEQRPGIEVRIHKLDGIRQLEAYLSRGLPAVPDKAKHLVLERLQKLDKGTRSQLEQAATSLAKAVQYGVEQYPAIVFDGELVVYGLTDLSVALTHYRHWQHGETP